MFVSALFLGVVAITFDYSVGLPRISEDDVNDEISSGQAVSQFHKIPLTRVSAKSNQKRMGWLAGHPHERLDDIDVYLMEMEIGTPGQKFKMAVDTVAAILTVISVKNKFNLCRKHTCFDESKSSTYSNKGDLLGCRIPSGWFMGYNSSDTVKLSDLTITDQLFVDVILEDRFSNQSSFDGILPLPPYSEFSLPPVLIKAKEEGLLKKNLFSLFMDRERPDGSFITFGDWDNNAYEGREIYWQPLVSPYGPPTVWMFNVPEVTFGGKLLRNNSGRAFVDSRRTNLVVSKSDLKSIVNILGATIDPKVDGILVKVSDIPNLPDLELTIGQKTFTLTPYDYIFCKDNKNNAIIGISTKYQYDIWILGQIFLSKFYSVYDGDDKKIGLAQAKGRTPTFIPQCK